MQFPLFVTTDRCYGKCNGVGRVQQVAKGVCVYGHHFHSVDWAYQPGMVANSARGQLKRENRLLETENYNTLHILASLGPFAVNALSHRLP